MRRSNSPVIWLNLVSSHVQQRSELNFGDALQLTKVETFAVTDVTSIVVHWISDGTGAFKQLGGRETVLVEWLVVRTAGLSEAGLEFWAVERGDIGD